MNDKFFLQKAIDQAKKSIEQGGFPAGSVVVKNRKIISSGISVGSKLNDPTSHAETISIRKACQNLKTADLSEGTLYASLQPCLMCFSAANWSGISRIVFACRKTDEMISKNYYEGKNDIQQVNEKNNRQIELIFLPDLEKDSLKLVKQWEANNLP